jgi:predicted RNA-binding Zn-ribbon protein involved in translation (DUF1610 family)
MQARCPQCGGEMEVRILSHPMIRIYMILVVTLVLGLVGLLIYACGLWELLKGLGLLLWCFVILPLLAWGVRFILFSDWIRSIGRGEQEKKHEKWKRERQQIEKMMQRDPRRVWMNCPKCGILDVRG